MKRLFIDEIDNMRDFGGFITKEGKKIKNNCLIRSNFPKNLSQKSLDKLVDKSITTVIDLRSEKEIEKNPGIFFDNKLFQYYNVRIKGDGRLPESPETVYDSYIEMLEGKEEIGEVFNIISRTKGGILFFCSAGKDRTGVISSLILKLLNVSEEDIIEDYVLSGVYLEKMLIDFANTMKKDRIIDIITPNRDTMIRVLAYIKENYNSIENYLSLCGVTSEEMCNIKNKVCE